MDRQAISKGNRQTGVSRESLSYGPSVFRMALLGIKRLLSNRHGRRAMSGQVSTMLFGHSHNVE